MDVILFFLIMPVLLIFGFAIITGTNPGRMLGGYVKFLVQIVSTIFSGLSIAFVGIGLWLGDNIKYLFGKAFSDDYQPKLKSQEASKTQVEQVDVLELEKTDSDGVEIVKESSEAKEEKKDSDDPYLNPPEPEVIE